MRRHFLIITIIALAGILLFNSCKKETSCEGCINGNKPPIANAGPDKIITLPTDSILLDGSASIDPDGTINNPIAITWLRTRVYAGTKDRTEYFKHGEIFEGMSIDYNPNFLQ